MVQWKSFFKENFEMIVILTPDDPSEKILFTKSDIPYKIETIRDQTDRLFLYSKRFICESNNYLEHPLDIWIERHKTYIIIAPLIDNYLLLITQPSIIYPITYATPRILHLDYQEALNYLKDLRLELIKDHLFPWQGEASPPQENSLDAIDRSIIENATRNASIGKIYEIISKQFQISLPDILKRITELTEKKYLAIEVYHPEDIFSTRRPKKIPEDDSSKGPITDTRRTLMEKNFSITLGENFDESPDYKILDLYANCEDLHFVLRKKLQSLFDSTYREEISHGQYYPLHIKDLDKFLRQFEFIVGPFGEHPGTKRFMGEFLIRFKSNEGEIDVLLTITHPPDKIPADHKTTIFLHFFYEFNEFIITQKEIISTVLEKIIGKIGKEKYIEDRGEIERVQSAIAQRSPDLIQDIITAITNNIEQVVIEKLDLFRTQLPDWTDSRILDALQILINQGNIAISGIDDIRASSRQELALLKRIDENLNSLIALTRRTYDETEVNGYLTLLSRLEKEITPEKFDKFYDGVLKTDVWTPEDKAHCIRALKKTLNFDKVFKKSARQKILSIIFKGLSLFPGGIVGTAVNELYNYLKGKWNL